MDVTDLMNVRIDAHHHLWDLADRDQPWLSSAVMAPIRRSFGVADLRTEAFACGMTATIVVQTVADVKETESLVDLADHEPLIAGVIGFVDLTAADVGEQLDRLLARPSGSRLVGIRNLVQDEPDPAWLLRPDVLAGLREVARHGLAYDLLVRAHQLDAAVGAVHGVSECRFVLDHLAKPAIACGNWEPWASKVSALAASENVVAKLSGLITEADWANWSTADLRPYVDHALSAFGPDRLMFGSDWPVCTLAAPYERVVEVTEELVSALSADEHAAIFGASATRAYRLSGEQT